MNKKIPFLLLRLFLLFTFEMKLTHAEDLDTPEVELGHRLFRETRFAQYFYAHSPSNVNQRLQVGDPTVAVTRTLHENIPGPYAGKSINCASCHLVEEHRNSHGGGMRSYSDFSRRSLIPVREDMRTETPRNSPSMVNASITRSVPFFLHYDGQFATVEDLVKGTLTGRNYGWLPNESQTALKHIARVVREDDGTDDLTREYPGSYATVLRSTDPSISEKLRLPAKYRLDLDHASDEQIIDAIANLIGAYMRSLVFSKDEQGYYNGSPYDLFLQKNHLPRGPRTGESPINYSRRLKNSINRLQNPIFITESDGHFEFQDSASFSFREKELKGLKIFLREKPDATARRKTTPNGIGNCVACHTPPDFTDFKFHNIGATQDEYDQIHGPGKFAKLFIPSLEQRNRRPEIYLPPSESHPRALGLLMSIPTLEDPRKTDLGVWNVFENPAQPLPQSSLRNALVEVLDIKSSFQISDEELLEKSIALFKTSSVRDLGQSEPYMHTGQMDQIEDVIRLYIRSSELMRQGKLRNGDPELKEIELNEDDVEPLTAFLKSLNEDYH